MTDINDMKDAACFLLCGACVVVLGWIAVAPQHFAATLIALLAPIGRMVAS